MNAEQASKRRCGSRPDVKAGKAAVLREATSEQAPRSRRGIGDGMSKEGIKRNTGSLRGGRSGDQPDAREGQAGPQEVAERSVVARKPGNSRGAKGP